MPELPVARTKAERLFYERLQQLSAQRRAIVLRAVGDPPDFDRLPLPIVLKLIEDQKFDAWKFYVLIYILAFTAMRREYGGLTEPLPDLADEDHFGPPLDSVAPRRRVRSSPRNSRWRPSPRSVPVTFRRPG